MPWRGARLGAALLLCAQLAHAFRLAPQLSRGALAPVPRTTAPFSLLGLLPSDGAAGMGGVTIRTACAEDAEQLATLCTDVFFGTHTFIDGPIIFFQRSRIFKRVLAQVTRRIQFENQRECQLLVAIDPSTGEVCGCADLAVHLYNEREKCFELTVDELPKGRGTYSWQPYVASVAVREGYRRKGIARMMMCEAERAARQWGYSHISLEVGKDNDAAMQFYLSLGYKRIHDGFSGVGATKVKVRRFWWEVRFIEKVILRRSLGRPY